MNATIRFEVPLNPGDVMVGATNSVAVRFNGSNGVVSGIRVIALNFRDAAGDDIIPANAFTHEDPADWIPPMNNLTDINAGAYLWANAPLIDDPINQRPIIGTCASCHFADGSDLKYFNYSSDSIVTRSRFHGLTEEEGEQIASYIRSLTNENPGRPWNPPFQPGPGLDPDPTDTPAEIQSKAENWLAGAGIEWAVDEEAEIYDHVFPNGATRAEVAKIMDHRGTYSVREIPIPLQFPDWNGSALRPFFRCETLGIDKGNTVKIAPTAVAVLPDGGGRTRNQIGSRTTVSLSQYFRITGLA